MHLHLYQPEFLLDAGGNAPITRWIISVAKVVMAGAVPEGSTQALFGSTRGVFMSISFG
jgi:hypothetical protein